MFRTGPFHTALRAAIAARGLSLERLRDRLAARGHAVSVSTLSNWQRGVGRPRRPESLRAVAALESLLALPEGTLVRLLREPAPRGRGGGFSPGTPRPAARRLRAALGAPEDPGVDLLAFQDDVTVTGAGWVVRARIVLRARRPGVDRYAVLLHTHSGALPDIRPGRDCVLGRGATDPESALTGTELLFPALCPGETFPLEYEVRARLPEPYYGRWFPAAGARLELTLRFAPEAAAREAHRIWRLDAHSTHKDLERLRLLPLLDVPGGSLVHLADSDVVPGFHGVRWAR
ncbi:hypothetical protein HUT18_15405 [Streptomyces sp. NA04227]|uniref:hypothetical protein n=1 Tax=Streptomyces sp. NA04227 TaxID=2742136 RepID=UPI00159061A3|nr:hypothetical protein [Streptomyces sp. NA04227]QKW07558.1 hypothetical protein HUT18_15405 [Streptomyces sp. NA04227]